jgi:microcystin-dependent protein
MADPFVAEIRIFPFNFPPRGWAFCDGQLLPLSQNTALFSLLGTFYGGNGQSTFALPNLQGNVPVHVGQGSGLSSYFIGQEGGSETVTLLESEMPAHAHQARCLGAFGDQPTAQNNSWARSTANPYINTQNGQMSPQALAPSGSSFPHNNMQPYLTLNFCIAMQGVFPPRP